MDEWIICSLMASFFYALWAINLKLASKTIDSTTSTLLSLPIRTVVILTTAFSSSRRQTTFKTIKNIRNLNIYGVLYIVASSTAAAFAGFFYRDALSNGGSGSAVAAISGSSPAVAYFISVILGLEELETTKVLGLCLAVASCYCFAAASK